MSQRIPRIAAGRLDILHEMEKMRPSVRLLTVPLLVVAAAACGGGDSDDGETADTESTELGDARSEDDTGTDTVVGTDDTDSAGSFSGGVIAGDFSRTCELLSADTVAETMGIEATSELLSSGETQGVCAYGADGSVKLSTYLPEETVGIAASDFLDQKIGFEESEGTTTSAGDFQGLPRAVLIKDGVATVALVADPYYVELIDDNDQDVLLSTLLGPLVDALR